MLVGGMYSETKYLILCDNVPYFRYPLDIQGIIGCQIAYLGCLSTIPSASQDYVSASVLFVAPLLVDALVLFRVN